MNLSIQNISKSYKRGQKKALDHFSAELSCGVYGFLGPNGAGKSTLMNIITGNLQADEGKILYNGADIRKLGREFRGVLGFMPQQQALYDDFTANRFLWYMAGLKGLHGSRVKEKIAEVLSLVNLSDCAHKKLGAFSGGMKQRILIAQALLADPEVILLDEPTAGLDPKERIRIRNFISEISLDKIVILATHVVSDIEYIAKEIILIKQGHLLQQGAPADIIRELQGSVHEAHLSKQALHEIKDACQISNIVTEGDGVRVRIVGGLPSGLQAAEGPPTLEDIYLSLFETA